MAKRSSKKTRTVYKEELTTQRNFRHVKEQEIKHLMNVIRIVCEQQGFKIKGRITFEHIQTGEVFK